MNPVFFATPLEFRAWLEQHHTTQTELWVGYYKKDTKKPSITWPESVDQALCFGWIDGIRKSLGPESYTIRFTPRKKSSIWSAVNLMRMVELIEQGLVYPKGLEIYQNRDPKKAEIYSHEREEAQLEPAHQQVLEASPKAWEYFQKQAPSYRKAAILWVLNAKQEATRLKRLQTLIEDSQNGYKIAPMRRQKTSG